MKTILPVAATLLTLGASPSASQTPPPKTRVVILGVAHSAQLTAESYQPAVFRAFFDRVKPAAFGIERSPEQFARNDHYEFTYEIQYLAVPYARERNIALQPIDWYPSLEDQLLGFGIDLDAPPIVRPASGFQSFLTFGDSADVRRTLFFGDDQTSRRRDGSFGEQPQQPRSRDIARRLFLYRTFMQARRISRMASAYRGKTVLVMIGVMHKDDIEQVLADDPGIELVQPSTFGAPSQADVDAQIRREDLMAIASFNLLALQSAAGVVDWAWMRRVVDRLQRMGSTPEIAMFVTRLGVLTGMIPTDQAVTAYERIARDAGPEARFTWAGVKDSRRLDSFIDPFGNLRIAQRARIERARALYQLRRNGEADSTRVALRAELSPPMQAQLDGYWRDFVLQMR